MNSYEEKYRYYPYIDRSGYIVDQLDRQRQAEYMEHQFDGSPFKVYDHNGRINKALPLNFRPPIGKTFPGFRGDIVRDEDAPQFYDCQSCYGNLIMSPNNKLIRPS